MKIFVIITTKNRIDLLSKAILSVSNQTRKPDEIILVTDSSTISSDNFPSFI